MHLFMDYLQPLTAWIYQNPNWALFITFLISFSESLAIIGSIIPGSVTMTAIGILAGSGVMRIDLTLVAATLGAIVGDSASYMLGFTFRNSLGNIWPFSRYPHWLKYGQQYFAKHGGKSVLIGRFIGPLRSIIPVIAGMMKMNRWHFLLVNVISAIGWSIVYIMPGVLIGAASSDLSAENASRLFILILLLLVVAWLLGLGIKWLVIRTHLYLKDRLHNTWFKLLHHSNLKRYINNLTPDYETSHYPTAGLVLLFFLSLTISVAIILLVIQSSWVSLINQPVHFFFQTLYTHYFNVFFIAISLFTQPLSLITLFLSIALYLIYFKDWRTLFYWISLAGTIAIILFGLNYFIETPLFTPSLNNKITLRFPSFDITFATTLFGFLIFYISTRYRTTLTLSIRIILFILLFLVGIGTIYLGKNWLTSVLGAYFIGLTICLGHWILYRRVNKTTSRSQLPIVFSCLVLILATAFLYFMNYKDLIQTHQPYVKHQVLSESEWWNQIQLQLPLHTTNRFGRKTGLFNIQYVGSIKYLEQALITSGWETQSNTFFNSLMQRANGKKTGERLPLLAQTYQNHKPLLVMTCKQNNNHPLLILRLWRSNYYLEQQNEPIWLGSIRTHLPKKQINTSKLHLKNPEILFNPLREALNNKAAFKEIDADVHQNKISTHTVAPIILIKVF